MVPFTPFSMYSTSKSRIGDAFSIGVGEGFTPPRFPFLVDEVRADEEARGGFDGLDFAIVGETFGRQGRGVTVDSLDDEEAGVADGSGPVTVLVGGDEESTFPFGGHTLIGHEAEGDDASAEALRAALAGGCGLRSASRTDFRAENRGTATTHLDVLELDAAFGAGDAVDREVLGATIFQGDSLVTDGDSLAHGVSFLVLKWSCLQT